MCISSLAPKDSLLTCATEDGSVCSADISLLPKIVGGSVLRKEMGLCERRCDPEVNTV